jgi:hypothetical protein
MRPLLISFHVSKTFGYSLHSHHHRALKPRSNGFTQEYLLVIITSDGAEGLLKAVQTEMFL